LIIWRRRDFSASRSSRESAVESRFEAMRSREAPLVGRSRGKISAPISASRDCAAGSGNGGFLEADLAEYVVLVNADIGSNDGEFHRQTRFQISMYPYSLADDPRGGIGGFIVEEPKPPRQCT
jgi:hypothetical protein